MNRYIFLFLIAAFSLLLHAKCVAQKNIVYGAGITYTVGIPTFVPPGNSSRVAIDTVTSKWYEYAQAGGWRWSGDRVQDISGCSAPAYTPGKAQSRLVLNACTEAQNGHGPELYKYTGSAWLCLNCGGNYTAGDGIDITGTEITNTAPDQVVSITGAGINAVTGAYPNFTVTGTEVDGSATNELQTLSVAGNNLTISDGNTVTLPTPSSTLDALTDVTITTPSNNQILQYNSATTQWVNATLAAITGSGTANYIAKWTGSAAQTTSQIFDNGTNIGIGTTGPVTKMHLLGNVGSGLTFRIENINSGVNPAYAQLELKGNNAGAGGVFKACSGYTGYKTILANDFGFTNVFSGNMCFLNDVSTGNINFSAGGLASGGILLNNINAVGVGTSSPNISAKIDITSTTSGILFPRMTATQRDAIASPPDGLVVYNTTAAKLQVRAASAWVDLH